MLVGLKACGSNVRSLDRTVVRTSVQVHSGLSASSELVSRYFKPSLARDSFRTLETSHKEVVHKVLGELRLSVSGVLRRMDEPIDGDVSHMHSWHPWNREHHLITPFFALYSRIHQLQTSF